MYRKDTDGWLKHWDFILLDMICLQLAFVLAYGLSGYGFNPYQTMIYRNMSIYIEVADIAVLFMLGTLRNVLKRGYYREFLITAYQSIVMGAVSVLYLFLIQQGQMYSRLAMILTFVLVYSVGLYYQNPVEKISAKQEKGSRKPSSAYCNY